MKSDSISLKASDCLSIKASLIAVISLAVVPFTYRLVLASALPSTLTKTKVSFRKWKTENREFSCLYAAYIYCFRSSLSEVLSKSIGSTCQGPGGQCPFLCATNDSLLLTCL